MSKKGLSYSIASIQVQGAPPQGRLLGSVLSGCRWEGTQTLHPGVCESSCCQGGQEHRLGREYIAYTDRGKWDGTRWTWRRPLPTKGRSLRECAQQKLHMTVMFVRPWHKKSSTCGWL